MKEVQWFRTHLERLGYSQSSVGLLPNCLKEFLEFTSKPVQQVRSADIITYHEIFTAKTQQEKAGGLE